MNDSWNWHWTANHEGERHQLTKSKLKMEEETFVFHKENKKKKKKILFGGGRGLKQNWLVLVILNTHGRRPLSRCSIMHSHYAGGVKADGWHKHKHLLMDYLIKLHLTELKETRVPTLNSEFSSLTCHKNLASFIKLCVDMAACELLPWARKSVQK